MLNQFISLKSESTEDSFAQVNSVEAAIAEENWANTWIDWAHAREQEEAAWNRAARDADFFSNSKTLLETPTINI